MLYYLGGKSYDAFVQPAFFLAGNRTRNGVNTVVAFKTLFTLGTCFQLFYSKRILRPYCSVSGNCLENCYGNKQ